MLHLLCGLLPPISMNETHSSLFFFSLTVCVCFYFHTQVTCLSCKHKSNTIEPFWDLSLEFPERYHSISKGSGSAASQRSCTLTEMLSKFTEMEALEGCIYACNQCNSEFCSTIKALEFVCADPLVHTCTLL